LNKKYIILYLQRVIIIKNPSLQVLKIELVLGYLDDVSIGRDLSIYTAVTEDFLHLQTMTDRLGLWLNKQKCKVITVNNACPLPQELSEFLLVEPPLNLNFKKYKN